MRFPVMTPRTAASRVAPALSVGSGGLVLLLGLTVLAGWYTHTLALLRICPGFVAMAYNTALGFALCGGGLLAAAGGRTRLAALGGALAGAIGLLTLAEYVVGAPLGLDELLMKEYIRAGIANPTRMAASTALCFALAGGALLLLGRTNTLLGRGAGRPARGLPCLAALIGALVAGLGTVALSGYFSGITAAYIWGHLTRMAVHTAVGFIVLGGGIIAASWQQERRRLALLGEGDAPGEGDVGMPCFVPMLAGVAGITITLCLWQSLVVVQSARDLLLLRLAATTKMDAATQALTRTHSLMPLWALVGGLELSLLLTWAMYLWQTARRQTRHLALAHREGERLNARLQAEVAERRRAEEEAHRAEETARRSEAQLQLITDIVPALIAYVDTEQRYRFINKGYGNWFGVPREAILGQSQREFLGEEVYQVVREHIEAALGGRRVEFEAFLPYPDGVSRHIQAEYAPDIAPTGEVRGFVLTAMDISARVQAEEALWAAHEELWQANAVLDRRVRERTEELERQREFLREVIDTDPSLIFVKDWDGTFTLVNQAVADLYGTTVESLVGKTDRDFNADPEEVERFLRDDRGVIASGRERLIPEEKVTDAQGRTHWLQTAKRPLRLPGRDRPQVLGISTDITARRMAEAEIAALNAKLEQRLDRIVLLNYELTQAYDATIEGWARALDLRDKETEGHSRRVTEMTLQLAEAMGLGDEELAQVRRGALLHDIGKLGIPDNILLKPGKLTDEEWVVMRQHPTFALEMLAPIAFLRPALDIPYCHHEKWDGTGYPRGLRGEQIPLAARLFAAVDVWDALRSDRPYREGWPVGRVLDHIAALSGTHFDPQVVEIFLEHALREQEKQQRLQMQAA